MSESRPGLREWLAEHPIPWPSVHALADGDLLVACYCVADVQSGLTTQKKPFLRIRLIDRSGDVDGMVWEEAERISELVEPGAFVGVRARVETFRGRRQLKLEEVARVGVRPEELDFFLPRSRRSPEEMEAELGSLVASIADPGLRGLCGRLLDPDGETGRWYRQSAAAKRNHHAVVGGLLEHSLSVAGACDRLATHYGTDVDRDLLIAGALLHDIGKTRELSVEVGFPYTDEGKLLGHIVIGLQMVERAAREVAELPESRRTLLLHLIASHQGRYEWQSPREPLTVEALILHYVDDLDAKMSQVLQRLDEVEEGWSSYDRSLGREFLRHVGGRDPAAEPRAKPDSAHAADRPSAPPPAAAPEGPTPAPDPRPAADPAAPPAEQPGPRGPSLFDALDV